jgi:fructosamine-3-kinase
MNSALAADIEEALEVRITRADRVSGGDIHAAYRVGLDDGRSIFVKGGSRALPGMFAAEARGLGWLAEPGTIRLPEVLAWSDGFLALEWIDRGRPARDHDQRLGRGLALLHRAGAPSFGLDHDNFLATLPQNNAARSTWAELYGEARLRPLLARAEADGHATKSMRRAVENVIERLPSLVGPEEPPARLHGDLWGGNAMVDDAGGPVLVDPAVYGGHREMDLAMMRLFGGFSNAVFAAYEEAFPLAPGHEERVPLYQLYPLLAHVCLFGRGYVASVERTAARCG